MKIILMLVGIFALIIVSVFNNIPVMYPLAAGLIIAGAVGISEGYGFKSVCYMAVKGMKKTALIYKVFILIGIIISMWMASGTVPGLMYYGLMLIKPQTVIVLAFLLTSIVSMLLGTSFGTVSTIGIALMAVGRGFGVNIGLLSGAIISGAYLGDRSSPMSSSAILTAAVTESKLYDNLKHMISTLIPALLISLALYYITGVAAGGQSSDMSRISELKDALMSSFKISPLVLIPPLFIIILPLFKVDIKLNMLIGIIIGGVLAAFVQGNSLIDILKSSVFGYDSQLSNDMLSGIVKGGGIISMLNAGITIAVSSALNGIFEETGMLENVLSFFTKKIRSIGQLIFKTFIMSLISSMYGCSQALSIMLTGNIMKPVFKRLGISSSSFARTIADTCVVLAPLVPWNIAGLVPASNMGVRVIDYAPYAFLCLILPVITIIFSYTGRIRKSNTNEYAGSLSNILK